MFFSALTVFVYDRVKIDYSLFVSHAFSHTQKGFLALSTAPPIPVQDINLQLSRPALIDENIFFGELIHARFPFWV